ncbi:hypothetical protein V7157_02015 [Neobacillus drentensis]
MRVRGINSEVGGINTKFGRNPDQVGGIQTKKLPNSNANQEGTHFF